jgi:CHASE2 domain-containing sensor protein
MLNQPKLWRLFITSPSLQALTIGLVTTFLATVIQAGAPATFSALDWTGYDMWLRHRAPIAVSPSLAIVARDPEAEERFGAGPWDRAILAQLIAAAHEAGAAAIGVDHRLDHASPAQLGGVASDALLMETVQTAGAVVFVYGTETTLSSNGVMLSHMAVSTDPDHVARHIPLFVSTEVVSVPAFGSILYDLYRQSAPSAAYRTTTEKSAAALLNPVGNGSLATLQPIPVSSVWEAIQYHDDQVLEGWFRGKVVTILPNPVADGPWLLATGQSVSGPVAHLQLLNSRLTDNGLGQVGTLGQFGIAALLASAVAWCLLRPRRSIGLPVAGIVLAGYAALTAFVLLGTNQILPVALPLTAALFVLAGTTAWTHLTAGQRMVLIERDMFRLQQ